MSWNISVASAQLLESLANSIYDRGKEKSVPFCFTVKEVHIVEHWLKESIKAALEKSAEYKTLSSEQHHQ
jgi:hypothetical protein